MNAHEEYVTYAQAKALKELGFDWPCKAWWESEYGEWIFYDGYNMSSPARYNTQYNQWMLSAPTQAVACRWLREEKGLGVEAFMDKFDVLYAMRIRRVKDVAVLAICTHLEDTYEAALSAGIDRVLELLKGGER